jgi:hypothetical protein
MQRPNQLLAWSGEQIIRIARASGQGDETRRGRRPALGKEDLVALVECQ